MTTLTTRGTKGSELTHNELDANFDQDVKVKTTTYACLVSDNRSVIECNHATVPFTVTLGDAATMAAADTGDYEVTIANIGAAAVTVARAGSDTIDGAATSLVLRQYSSVTLKVNAATDGYNTVARGALTGIDDKATSTAITIDSSENVGIGNSSLESWSLGYALQIGATTSVWGTDTQSFFSENAYYNSGWQYQTTSHASTYETSGGTHIFKVAPSGTADTAISWTTAFTINNDGSVTITDLDSPVINTGVSGTAVLDEDDMATDSDTQLATQQSIKAYVDALNVTSGTWTPTLQDASLSDGEGQTYSVQVGRYTTVGNRVFISGRLNVSGSGTLSGAVVIAGLPFTSEATANNDNSIYVGECGGASITAGQVVAGLVSANTDFIHLNLWDDVGGTTNMSITEVDNFYIAFSGSYEI